MNDETEQSEGAERKGAQPTDPVRAPKPLNADLTRVIDSLAQRALFAQIVGYLLLGIFCIVIGFAAFYSLASLSNNAAREQLARDIEGLRTDLTNTWQRSRDELGNYASLLGNPDQPATLMRDLDELSFPRFEAFNSLPRRERDAFRDGRLEWTGPALSAAPFDTEFATIIVLPDSRGFFVSGPGGAGLALRDSADWTVFENELVERLDRFIELAPGRIIGLGGAAPLYQVSLEDRALIATGPEAPDGSLIGGWQNAFALEGTDEVAIVSSQYIALAPPDLTAFRVFDLSLPFTPGAGMIADEDGAVFLFARGEYPADNRVARIWTGADETEVEMVAMPPLPDDVNLNDITRLPGDERIIVYDLNSSTAISIEEDYGTSLATAATLNDYARAVRSLPAWTRSAAPFAAYYTELERFERLDALYARQFRELNAEGLDGRTSSMLQFLKECRGVGRESTLLEACIDGYRTATGNTQLDLYRDLSERAGGIILLLFFLTAVGSLYRYNLKLVSFYKAREDMLQMAKSSLVAGELDAASLTALGQTLAAEHIEFKATQSPTGEIADIVKSLRGV